MRIGTCTICGEAFEGPARGPMPACCSANCAQENEQARRRAWRLANADRLRAQQAKARAGRPMIFDVPCRVCGKPVPQVRKAVGRHSRTCSLDCWQEQRRRTNRKHKAKLKAGGGRKSRTASIARPASPSLTDFISPPTNFEAAKVVSTGNDISQTLETQGVERTDANQSAEFFPFSFIFEPKEPDAMSQPDLTLDELHELQVRAVSRSVSRLVSHTGYAPEAIIEGALRGASAIGIGMGSSSDEMAVLVENFAFGLRNLDKPDLKVVQ